jgi:hypothetical protein
MKNTEASIFKLDSGYFGEYIALTEGGPASIIKRDDGFYLRLDSDLGAPTGALADHCISSINGIGMLHDSMLDLIRLDGYSYSGLDADWPCRISLPPQYYREL